MAIRDGNILPNVCLRIKGLPDAISFWSGSCYALSVTCADVADKLIWPLLASVCEAGTAACLVTAGSVSQSYRQSGLDRYDNALLSNPLLTLLEINADSQRKDADRLSHSVMEDLEHFGGGAHRMLIIDGAENLLTAACLPALTAWRSWAERCGTVVIFLFRQHVAGKKAPPAALSPFAHLLSGVSHIHPLSGSHVWEIAHWFGANGLHTRTCYPLKLDKQGGFSVRAAQMMVIQSQAHSSDEYRVFVQRSAMPVRESLDQDWQLIDDDSSLLEQMRGAVAATLILAFSKRTCFAGLARTIYRLRQQCGSHLKIFVREMGASLRIGEEETVLRLGTNLVVPSEVSHARLRRLTTAMRGQVFSFGSPCTFETFFDEAPFADPGEYLGPHDFATAVRKALSSKHPFRVETVLLRLVMAEGLLPLDGLACFGRKRAGDCVTCDDRSIYIFFRACRSADVAAALDRLFRSQIREMIMAEELFSTASSIGDATADLEYRHRVGAFADLSTDLVLRCLHGAQGECTSGQVNRTVDRLSFRAPAAAVRQPLLMKGPPPLAVVAGLPS